MIKAKKTKKWSDKLNKKELRHIAENSETGRATLKALKQNIEHQNTNTIPCFECTRIALKLDIFKKREA